MKGLAAVLVELGKPLVLEELEIPKLKYGQVLVKVLCSGICGSQIGEINGVKGTDKYLPHLLGHEGTGLVLECGEGVNSVNKDDKVVLHWRKGDGIQSPAPTYHSKNLGTVNAGWVTTFNQYAVVSENRITTIPEDFDSEISDELKKNDIDLILLIGFMRILSNEFCKAWQGKIVNVHPSLLPKYSGGMDMNIHEQVIKNGDKESGCTIHFVTEKLDKGPILIQKKCKVNTNETPETLKVKIQELEGNAFVEAINQIAKDNN